MDEEVRRQLADMDSRNTKLSSGVQYLRQELKQESAQTAKAKHAKQELEELKAKLVEMGAGVKVKTGIVEQ